MFHLNPKFNYLDLDADACYALPFLWLLLYVHLWFIAVFLEYHGWTSVLPIYGGGVMQAVSDKLNIFPKVRKADTILYEGRIEPDHLSFSYNHPQWIYTQKKN